MSVLCKTPVTATKQQGPPHPVGDANELAPAIPDSRDDEGTSFSVDDGATRDYPGGKPQPPTPMQRQSRNNRRACIAVPLVLLVFVSFLVLGYELGHMIHYQGGRAEARGWLVQYLWREKTSSLTILLACFACFIACRYGSGWLLPSHTVDDVDRTINRPPFNVGLAKKQSKHGLKSSMSTVLLMVALFCVPTFVRLYSLTSGKASAGTIDSPFLAQAVLANQTASAVLVEEKAQLVPPQLIQSKPTDTDAAGNGEITHIIITRFMQHQPNLIDLGLARLALFETFCLPTILAQTEQNFIWIIRADPQLNNALLEPLVKLLDGKPNFILVGSNYNPSGFSRRGGQSFDTYFSTRTDSSNRHIGEGPKAQFRSGNETMVQDAYERVARGKGLFIETRLDADDGLQHNFIAKVQLEARTWLSVSGDVDKDSLQGYWRIWCLSSSIQWHPISGGYLVPDEEGWCITPGLTYGFGANNVSSVPFVSHHKVMNEYAKCSKKTGVQRGCYSTMKKFMGEEGHGAVRARTATSAGMKDIYSESNSESSSWRRWLDASKNEQGSLWDQLHASFSISRGHANKTIAMLEINEAAIAADNLAGQCTPGHSCKDSSVRRLKRVVK